MVNYTRLEFDAVRLYLKDNARRDPTFKGDHTGLQFAFKTLYEAGLADGRREASQTILKSLGIDWTKTDKELLHSYAYGIAGNVCIGKY